MSKCKSRTIEAAAGQRFILGKRLFSAIVAANDRLALEGSAALSAAGLKRAADVSVTGYHDRPFAEYFAPPLTTLRTPLAEMGNQTALRLPRKIRDPKTPLPSVQPRPSLFVRGSTARLSHSS